MNPDDLLYSKSHEWVMLEDDVATIGITDFAQGQLGDITFVELPALGDVVSAGEEMGTVESVKAASEIYSPVDGEVIEVNTELDDAPELVNQAPYGEGWMIRVKLSAQPEDLMTASAYEAMLDSEDH
ncbi:MAG: glycine cleavage system protein GcvH [Desulfovibrionaceae bacterium]